MITQWFDSFLLWAGLGGLGVTALVGAAWFFGLMPLLGAVAQVAAAILTPILKAVVEGAVWLWQRVFWPGLWDILEDWVTVFTVLAMGAVLWFGIATRYELRHLHDVRAVNTCQAALVKARKGVPKYTPAPVNPFKWPWE